LTILGRPSIIPHMHADHKRLSLVFLILLFAMPCGAVTIDHLTPFTTDSSVRVDLALSSEQQDIDVDLEASIFSLQSRQVIWSGALGKLHLTKGKQSQFSHTIEHTRAPKWSPMSPSLHILQVAVKIDGMTNVSKSVRIGFRSFEARDGHFWLNGKPIFLRGLAINPPGRSIPQEVGESRAFALAYVKYLRSQNLNIIRLHHDSQVWFDVCDELGMMVDQGVYGSPPLSRKKEQPPENVSASVAEYKKLFETYTAHPSVVVYVLSNELPWTGTRGKQWHEFLTEAHKELSQWDPSHPYIGNAGYGQGHEGDVNDVHRYWGWYYNSFLTYYNVRDAHLFGDYDKNQPLTFSECVGCFTGPLGEFNLTYRKQLAAQLEWTGHAGDQRAAALKYQAFMIKQAIESFRRMRAINPRISGLMPFTIPFFNWEGIASFDQTKPKPAVEQMGVSYQPVLLSWECWTPQVYAGTKVHAFAHVVNDAENGSDLTGAVLEYDVRDSKENAIMSGTLDLPTVAYYATSSHPIELALPESTPTGEYRIHGTIRAHNYVVSNNDCDLFVAGSDWKKRPPESTGDVSVFDPSGKTIAALAQLGIKSHAVNDGAALKQVMHDGGHVLCILPDDANADLSWVPAKMQLLTGSINDATYPVKERPTRDGMNINPERLAHPVFAGLSRERLALWSDFTAWDQTKTGFPQIYPVTRGIKLLSADDLAKTAILADYDRGLDAVALCEVFDGQGSVVLCGFDVLNRVGLDPAADRLLANLAAYTLSDKHELHPLITGKIVWGNYPTERGVVTGPLNGLVYNCRWTPSETNQSNKPMPDNEGSWNELPGDQYIPKGIRIVGPFTYSTGATPKELDPDNPIGTGVFYAAVPPKCASMTTKVENPTTQALTLKIQVNGVEQQSQIDAGQTVVLRNEVTGDKNAVQVRYSGDKHLVILETWFE
jgi:beta-galactosidase